MSFPVLMVISGLLGAGAVSGGGGFTPVSSEAVRATIGRSLGFLEREGTAWMENRKCVSCHQIPVMVWSHYEARARGIAVEGGKLSEWTDWSLGKLSQVRKANMDGINQFLLGVVALDDQEDRAGRMAQLSDVVLANQEADGSWKAGGQLPRQDRPEGEIDQVYSTWAMLALASVNREGEVMDRGRERIKEWLTKNAAGKSFELSLVRLLAEAEFGDSAKVAERIQAVFDGQQSDGGWARGADGPSDPLTTGQALYALARSGVSPAYAGIERAISYLVTTQGEDGSWQVMGTRKGEKGATATATCWGTGWAVIGLSRSLGD